jgi:hypothetical protein
MARSNILVHYQSPVTAKIALFRSLSRGREDVYPRRFESRKTGRCGYQPACANEWARGLCEKPKVKCSACPHRRFLPVTDDAICRHLSGQDADGRPFVMGIYPMLQDETCFFLAVDFDKTNWQEDIEAFGNACQRWNLPIVMERSRSGNGGHAWFFFATAIPAALARKLVSHIVTEMMEQRPDSYCKNTATSCCGFWPKMSARISISCSTRSCERCRIVGRRSPKRRSKDNTCTSASNKSHNGLGRRQEPSQNEFTEPNVNSHRWRASVARASGQACRARRGRAG